MAPRRGGGRFSIENPTGGGGFSHKRGGVRGGPGGCLQGILWEELNIFFSGLKCPPRSFFGVGRKGLPDCSEADRDKSEENGANPNKSEQVGVTPLVTPFCRSQSGGSDCLRTKGCEAF